MIKQHSAGIVLYTLVDGKREYLLMHYMSGHWDFAKGKIEPGETKEQAAHRELKEETGLTATIVPGFEESFAYMFKDRSGELIHKTVDFFTGYTQEKKVTISREHQGYIWLPYKQAQARLTYKNAKEVLAHAEHFNQLQEK